MNKLIMVLMAVLLLSPASWANEQIGGAPSEAIAPPNVPLSTMKPADTVKVEPPPAVQAVPMPKPKPKGKQPLVLQAPPTEVQAVPPMPRPRPKEAPAAVAAENETPAAPEENRVEPKVEAPAQSAGAAPACDSIPADLKPDREAKTSNLCPNVPLHTVYIECLDKGSSNKQTFIRIEKRTDGSAPALIASAKIPGSVAGQFGHFDDVEWRTKKIEPRLAQLARAKLKNECGASAAPRAPAQAKVAGAACKKNEITGYFKDDGGKCRAKVLYCTSGKLQELEHVAPPADESRCK